VQVAMKNILEPVFEADFYPVSQGSRPGNRVHGALEHLRLLMRPKASGGNPNAGSPIHGPWKGYPRLLGCRFTLQLHVFVDRQRGRAMRREA
jgi:RNA-directed DNA polymerase